MWRFNFSLFLKTGGKYWESSGSSTPFYASALRNRSPIFTDHKSKSLLRDVYFGQCPEIMEDTCGVLLCGVGGAEGQFQYQQAQPTWDTVLEAEERILFTEDNDGHWWSDLQSRHKYSAPHHGSVTVACWSVGLLAFGITIPDKPHNLDLDCQSPHKKPAL